MFRTLREVVDFYDAGGGAGRGLAIRNQTLSADSLRLTPQDKDDLIAFIHSLTEAMVFDDAPKRLPQSTDPRLNRRTIGGDY